MPESPAVMPDPLLLDILVCPKTRGPLTWDAEHSLLISESAGLAYPVREGVPIMLVEEAHPWPPAKEDAPKS